MRMPGNLHMGILQAIRLVASQTPDLRDPISERLILKVCEESYRAGVIEMQEPIKLWMKGPGPHESDQTQQEN